MALNPRLLEILACPLCQSEVRLTADGQGLVCAACRHVYPVRDGIPVMLADEAAAEPGPPEGD